MLVIGKLVADGWMHRRTDIASHRGDWDIGGGSVDGWIDGQTLPLIEVIG